MGNIELLSHLQDAPILFVVQILAFRVGVDQAPLESEFLDRSFQLGSRFFRVLRSQGGHAGESIGILSGDFEKLVVDLLRHGCGSRRVKDLNTGTDKRKDLHIDSCFIHIFESSGSKIEKLIASDFTQPRLTSGDRDVKPGHLPLEVLFLLEHRRERIGLFNDGAESGHVLLGGEMFLNGDSLHDAS